MQIHRLRQRVPECPVATIVNAAEITDDQRPFIELNERLTQHPDWKPIKTSKMPLPGHAQWASVAMAWQPYLLKIKSSSV